MLENKSLKSYIEELIEEIQKELDEATTSGNVDGYDIPGAFSDNGAKDKARKKKVATQFGMKIVDNDIDNINESQINEWKLQLYLGNVNPSEFEKWADSSLQKKHKIKVSGSGRNWTIVGKGNDDRMGSSADWITQLLGKAWKTNKIKVVQKESVNEVGAGDWHFKAIQKLYQKAGVFTKKKIAALITKNPNSTWSKIEKELRGSDYDDVTYYTDMLHLEGVVNKLKSINESSNDKQKVVDYLIKKGNNKNDAQKMVDKNYDYVSNKYKGASISKKAEIISGLQESVNEGTKYKVGQKTPVGKIIGTSVWGKGSKQEWFYDVQKPGYSPKQYSEKSLDKIMGESINENRWLELKNDTSMHANKKLATGLKELKYQLAEVEKFFTWYNKIKNINELDSENYWKRTNTHIYKIKERLINIAKTLQEIEK
jgi:polyhydroxyalkanoate synthesis regulator phasin